MSYKFNPLESSYSESLINRDYSVNSEARTLINCSRSDSLFAGGINKRENGTIMIQAGNDSEESSAGRMSCIHCIQR